MEFKGTKGEWIIDKGDKVMVLTEKGAYRPNSMFSYTSSIKELEANAKLIAAAPDLLEALQSCVHSMNEQLEHLRIELNEKQFSNNLNIAEKAIYKALN